MNEKTMKIIEEKIIFIACFMICKAFLYTLYNLISTKQGKKVITIKYGILNV